MPTLGISRKEQLISRFCFYGLVLGAMWLTDRSIPENTTQGLAHSGIYPAARPYIAVPVAELDFVPDMGVSR